MVTFSIYRNYFTLLLNVIGFYRMLIEVLIIRFAKFLFNVYIGHGKVSGRLNSLFGIVCKQGMAE